jgi:uncharacterized protein
MAIDLKSILEYVLRDYSLPITGFHGVAHWARVLENGLKLQEETNATIEVVQLFAVLHDCRRVNEDTDPDHGPRAADLAIKLNGSLFTLPPAELDRLYNACYYHTHARTHPDITVQNCFDADRLDLGRVGIKPSRKYLSTEIAKREDIMTWSNDRAVRQFVPELVKDDWGLELPQYRRWK